MKANTKKYLVVIILSTLMAGCSSIRARSNHAAAQWNVYPGVRQDVKEIGEIMTGQRKDPIWVNVMVTTILLVDLPISALFDTLVTPYDVYRIHRVGQPTDQ
ncbi:MAG TPA: YceK/YidQ family lipoprotein [Methylothermaceae bacterium]|nr:YceK/YidQ family lipoprotein [Methylothermaceae bacterium]